MPSKPNQLKTSPNLAFTIKIATEYVFLVSFLDFNLQEQLCRFEIHRTVHQFQAVRIGTSVPSHQFELSTSSFQQKFRQHFTGIILPIDISKGELSTPLRSRDRHLE